MGPLGDGYITIKYFEQLMHLNRKIIDIEIYNKKWIVLRLDDGTIVKLHNF